MKGSRSRPSRRPRRNPRHLGVPALCALALCSCSSDQPVGTGDEYDWAPFDATFPPIFTICFAASAGGDLYVAGSSVARWSPPDAAWFPLAGRLYVGPVETMTHYRGELIAGGRSAPAETLQTGEILEVMALAAWRDSTWEEIGQTKGTVHDLAVYDDLLVVAGDFQETTVGVRYLAGRDGAVWAQIGGRFDGPVRSVHVDGDDLIVGGAFTAVGDVPMDGVARWDGSDWSAVGFDLYGEVHRVTTLEGRLVAVGWFKRHAPPAPRFNVAIQTEDTWENLGDLNMLGAGRDVAIFHDDLYVAGAEGVFEWTGVAWHRALPGIARGLHPYEGSLLVAGALPPGQRTIARIE